MSIQVKDGDVIICMTIKKSPTKHTSCLTFEGSRAYSWTQLCHLLLYNY